MGSDSQMKCVSAADIHTMSHMVDSCPLTKLEGGLHATDKAAVDWQTSCGAQKYTKHHFTVNCV